MLENHLPHAQARPRFASLYPEDPQMQPARGWMGFGSSLSDSLCFLLLLLLCGHSRHDIARALPWSANHGVRCVPAMR